VLTILVRCSQQDEGHQGSVRAVRGGGVPWHRPRSGLYRQDVEFVLGPSLCPDIIVVAAMASW
jgi:hypothetical protein